MSLSREQLKALAIQLAAAMPPAACESCSRPDGTKKHVETLGDWVGAADTPEERQRRIEYCSQKLNERNESKRKRAESKRIGVVKMPAYRAGTGRKAIDWAGCIWQPPSNVIDSYRSAN